MKKKISIILLLFITMLFFETYAQKFETKKIEGFIISGVGAMIDIENKNLKCVFVPSSDQRKKEYQDVDIQTGDEIQYINGKRVKTLNEFKKQYNGIKVGVNIDLGLKRGESMLIASFKKAEADPSQKIQVLKSDGSGKTGEGNVTPMKIMIKDGKATMNGRDVNLDSLKKSLKGKVKIKK